MAVGRSLDRIKWVSVGLRVSKLLEQNVAVTSNDGGVFPRLWMAVGRKGKRKGGRYMAGEKQRTWLLPNCCMFLSF